LYYPFIIGKTINNFFNNIYLI